LPAFERCLPAICSAPPCRAGRLPAQPDQPATFSGQLSI
jgi:hypothetical protein